MQNMRIKREQENASGKQFAKAFYEVFVDKICSKVDSILEILYR